MTLILKQIFGLIHLLNSDKGTNQISAGIAAGFILGMTPSFSLQTLLVVLIILFFRIQVGAALLGAFFFSFIAYLLDPLFHTIGSMVLQMGSLQPILTSLYNMPIIPYTRFYNSIVMGSGIVALFLAPFIFFGARYLVEKYREKVVAKLQETKLWKAVKATSFYKWYYKYDKLYG